MRARTISNMPEQHTFFVRKAPQEAERLLVAARVESDAKAIARDEFEGAGALRDEVLSRRRKLRKIDVDMIVCRYLYCLACDALQTSALRRNLSIIVGLSQPNIDDGHATPSFSREG